MIRTLVNFMRRIFMRSQPPAAQEVKLLPPHQPSRGYLVEAAHKAGDILQVDIPGGHARASGCHGLLVVVHKVHDDGCVDAYSLGADWTSYVYCFEQIPLSDLRPTGGRAAMVLDLEALGASLQRFKIKAEQWVQAPSLQPHWREGDQRLDWLKP